MGRLLDRTPIIVMVLVGCAFGGFLGIADLVMSSVPALAAVWSLAGPVALRIVVIGFALSLLVGWLRGLYWLAFEQPLRNLPGRPRILQLLLGLGYASAAMLALDIGDHLIDMFSPSFQAPSSYEILSSWVLHGWLIPAVEVVPVLVVMRLMADPWQRVRARFIQLAAVAAPSLRARLGWESQTPGKHTR